MDEHQFRTILDHIDENSKRIDELEKRLAVATASILRLTNDLAEVRGGQEERIRVSGITALLVSAVVSGVIALIGFLIRR